MAAAEDHGPELPPSEIAEHAFTTSRRGYDAAEVRAFLATVADGYRALLARTVEAETGAATAIEAAEARAAEIVQEARDEANRLLSGVVDERQRGYDEGVARAEEVVAEAEETGRRAVAEAAREAERLIAEAEGARRKVLRDLKRRRKTARTHLEQLQAARERLLGALAEVRAQVETTTAGLRDALPEAKAAAEAAARRVAAEEDITVDQLEGELQAFRLAGLPLAAHAAASPSTDGVDDPTPAVGAASESGQVAAVGGAAAPAAAAAPRASAGTADAPTQPGDAGEASTPGGAGEPAAPASARSGAAGPDGAGTPGEPTAAAGEPTAPGAPLPLAAATSADRSGPAANQAGSPERRSAAVRIVRPLRAQDPVTGLPEGELTPLEAPHPDEAVRLVTVEELAAEAASVAADDPPRPIDPIVVVLDAAGNATAPPPVLGADDVGMPSVAAPSSWSAGRTGDAEPVDPGSLPSAPSTPVAGTAADRRPSSFGSAEALGVSGGIESADVLGDESAASQAPSADEAAATGGRVASDRGVEPGEPGRAEVLGEASVDSVSSRGPSTDEAAARGGRAPSATDEAAATGRRVASAADEAAAVGGRASAEASLDRGVEPDGHGRADVLGVESVASVSSRGPSVDEAAAMGGGASAEVSLGRGVEPDGHGRAEVLGDESVASRGSSADEAAATGRRAPSERGGAESDGHGRADVLGDESVASASSRGPSVDEAAARGDRAPSADETAALGGRAPAGGSDVEAADRVNVETYGDDVPPPIPDGVDGGSLPPAGASATPLDDPAGAVAARPAGPDRGHDDGTGEPSAADGGARPAPDAVDAVFARLKADRAARVAAAEAVLDPPDEATSPAPTATLDSDEPTSQAAAAPRTPAAPAVVDDVVVHRGGGADREALLARRDDAVAPMVASLARRLKRLLADEQNELLTDLRNHGTASALLPAGEHGARWAAEASVDLAAAAAAGATYLAPDDPAAGPDPTPGDLVDVAEAFALQFAAPLHHRLQQVLDGEDDPEAASERVRSIYRTWRSDRLGVAVEHAVLDAFAAGIVGRCPAGTPVCWVVDDGGAPCPDGEDNALAGVVPCGEPFPTGHLRPPAHPGCRCLVVPAADLTGGTDATTDPASDTASHPTVVLTATG